MNCSENHCRGEIDKNNPVFIQIERNRRGPFFTVYPCADCKRLHLADGSPFFDGPGKAFLDEEGKVAHY